MVHMEVVAAAVLVDTDHQAQVPIADHQVVAATMVVAVILTIASHRVVDMVATPVVIVVVAVVEAVVNLVAVGVAAAAVAVVVVGNQEKVIGNAPIVIVRTPILLVGMNVTNVKHPNLVDLVEAAVAAEALVVAVAAVAVADMVTDMMNEVTYHRHQGDMMIKAHLHQAVHDEMIVVAVVNDHANGIVVVDQAVAVLVVVMIVIVMITAVIVDVVDINRPSDWYSQGRVSLVVDLNPSSCSP